MNDLIKYSKYLVKVKGDFNKILVEQPRNSSNPFLAKQISLQSDCKSVWQGILLALKLDSEAVRCDLEAISRVLCRLQGWYLENLPLEQMQYGVMIHLCGCHSQHIPTWKEMGAIKSSSMVWLSLI
jgi:hypothetical protein